VRGDGGSLFKRGDGDGRGNGGNPFRRGDGDGLCSGGRGDGGSLFRRGDGDGRGDGCGLCSDGMLRSEAPLSFSLAYIECTEPHVQKQTITLEWLLLQRVLHIQLVFNVIHRTVV
jgi:hypothetical protein